jgi:hypothetical protein
MTTWTKKSAKGWQEWDKLVAMVVYLPTSWKMPMKTRIASKVVFFNKPLEFVNVNNICYYCSSLQLQSKVPGGKTWGMARIRTKTFI